MNTDDLEFLFSFPIDRVDQPCRNNSPTPCGGFDDDDNLIVLRALMPLTDGHTAEAILCANHMDQCVHALGDLMEQGVARARRGDLK